MPASEPGVRLRFAPSPTGELHVGGARTALFNYLFARYHGGSLILRVEDTDRERSDPRFEESQRRDLKWIGLEFDEGPYRQSGRGAVYDRYLGRLRDLGLTYEAADEAGRTATYLRPPERRGSFLDVLHGEVTFAAVEDFVLVKSDGSPAYNFAAAADDSEMRITHVIRGEEHLSNTARQVQIYRALGLPGPEFLHLGLILGPDGKKLSKREGGASVAEYRAAGYLPEALVSHLALLGWSHPEGREEFESLEELAREWDPSRLGASPATFDPERLLSLNAALIRSLPVAELARRVQPFLEWPLPAGREAVAVEALQQEMRTLADAPRLLEELIGEVEPASFAYDLPSASGEVFERAGEELAVRHPETLGDGREFVAAMRGWAKERGLKTREVLHPLRLALTGRDRGPELAYPVAALGTEESRRRIESARQARLRA
ncbi:glutamate--tRNA ligase [Rubrobacter aplysinae]|uniref:glutamate--tRNA ligase n=1 Tax=Rubrobacter aplysinae TaxID=909625 RepID=UPI00064C4657|nr:glutamate--tRNA ligase family protein [Rubrobacter aplysinae]